MSELSEKENAFLDEAMAIARLAGVPEDKIRAAARATRMLRPWAYDWARRNPHGCVASVSAALGGFVATLEDGGLEIDMLEAALQRGMAIAEAKRSSGGRA